jgi:hypothetical protein
MVLEVGGYWYLAPRLLCESILEPVFVYHAFIPIAQQKLIGLSPSNLCYPFSVPAWLHGIFESGFLVWS